MDVCLNGKEAALSVEVLYGTHGVTAGDDSKRSILSILEALKGGARCRMAPDRAAVIK